MYGAAARVLCGPATTGCPLLRPSRRARRGRAVVLRVKAESPIVEEIQGVAEPTRGLSVFNRARWAHHQNSSRYLRHLQTIFKSTTFRNLQAPLSVLTLNACCVVLYRYLVDRGTVRTPFSYVFDGVNFTDTAFQLTSFALSLLLVFRTDASYGRWCAAMDAWSDLRSTGSDLLRKACAWVDNRQALERLVRWVSAFSRCLMVVLRHDTNTVGCREAIRAELRPVLLSHEVDQVIAAGPYYPQFCLSVLTALVESTHVGEGRESAMLGDLQTFNRVMGTCEKLLRFPIPLTYSRHTSRFMLIYLTALPIVLYQTCEWAAVPVTTIIAFLLLGIEDIGVQIEEPFSILPLQEVCADMSVALNRAVQQRAMVRCLADPSTCMASFDESQMLNVDRSSVSRPAAFAHANGESAARSSKQSRPPS